MLRFSRRVSPPGAAAETPPRCQSSCEQLEQHIGDDSLTASPLFARKLMYTTAPCFSPAMKARPLRNTLTAEYTTSRCKHKPHKGG